MHEYVKEKLVVKMYNEHLYRRSYERVINDIGVYNLGLLSRSKGML